MRRSGTPSRITAFLLVVVMTLNSFSGWTGVLPAYAAEAAPTPETASAIITTQESASQAETTDDTSTTDAPADSSDAAPVDEAAENAQQPEADASAGATTEEDPGAGSVAASSSEPEAASDIVPQADPVCQITSGGTTTSYESLSAAILAAADGDTIEMLVSSYVDSSAESVNAKTLTITTAASVGAACTITRAQTSGAVITVTNDGGLTLTDVTLDGDWNKTTSTSNPILAITSGSATLGDGCTIRNGSDTNGGDGGGGVRVVGSTSSCTMLDGATITDCSTRYGGGILVHGASFFMRGGTISNCYGTKNGYDCAGGVYLWGGNLYMTGGSITGCLATGGASAGGAGVGTEGSSNAYILGGSITGNHSVGSRVGGVDCGSGNIYIGGDATITGNYDGSVVSDYTVTAEGVLANVNNTTAANVFIADDFTGSAGFSYNAVRGNTFATLCTIDASGAVPTATTMNASASETNSHLTNDVNSGLVAWTNKGTSNLTWGHPFFKIVNGSTTTTYYSLADAITAANAATTAAGAKIQALLDYTETAADAAVPVTNATVPVTITTAATTGSYPYEGAATDGHAVITRGFTGASMFTASGSELDFANVTIDGDKATHYSTETGGIVHATSGTLALQSGATFQNSLVNVGTSSSSPAGGAVYLTGSGTKMTMADGSAAKDCETPSAYGGFLFQEGGTTFEATGGSIIGCKTTMAHGSGGAIMQAPGGVVTTILGGTFSASGCSASANGSFIHGGATGSTITFKDTASVTGCTGAGSSYTGGSVFPFNATIKVQDAPTLSGSVQANGTTAMNFYTSGIQSLSVTGNLTGGAFYVYGATGFYQKGQQFGTSAAANASSVSGLYDLRNDRDATLVGAAGGATGNKVVWAPTDDTIVFDKNASDATGTMDDEAVTYGTSCALTTNAYARVGYEFAGWNTAADGTGTAYADGASSKEFTNVYDSATGKLAKVTLYAQWKAVTFDNVFIGSTNAGNNSSLVAASDNNSGTSPSSAVATFAKAKSLLKPGGKIWIVGTVGVTSAQTWDLDGFATAEGTGIGTMQRWDGKSAKDASGAAYTDANAKACTTDLVNIAAAGKLTTTNITIDGGWKTLSAGQQGNIIQNVSGGSITLDSGTTLQNNYCTKGANTAGAVYVSGTASSCTIESGASITGCRAQYGGAISTFYGPVTMNGGTISDCTSTRAASDSPSAIEIYYGATFTMNDGEITNCRNIGTSAGAAGGAVYVESGTARLLGGSIHDNYGKGIGGGVYRAGGNGVILGGAISITDNFGGCTFDADGELQTTGVRSDLFTNGSGSYVKIVSPLTGAIGITESAGYHTALREFATGGTLVSGGTAYSVTATDAAAFYDDFVNQYGIESYGSDDAVRFKGYTVTYNKNGDGAGGTGSVSGAAPTDTTAYAMGSNVTLKSKNTMAYAGHTFVGWAVGAGDTTATAGQAGPTYVFPGTWAKTNDPTSNITLYAVWSENANYTVKYNTEGSTSPASYEDKTGVAWSQSGLLPGTPEKTGFTFDGWYTTSDKSGTQVSATTAYSQVAANDTDVSTTIYAVWTETTITGRNKVVTESAAKAATVDDSQVIAWNGVSGTVDGSTAPATVTGDNTASYAAIKAGTDGTYALTYQEGVGSAAKTATYTVTVVPDGSTIVDASADAAYAGTYIVRSTDAKSLAKDALLVDQNDYAAYHGQAIAAADMPGDHVAQVVADSDWAKITAGTLGTYSSNITCGAATSTDGKVIVVSDETVVSGDDAVLAQNTILTVDQAKALANAGLLYGSGLDTAATRIYNNVSGYVDGVVGTETSITQAFTSGTAWADIHTGTVGTYEVTYMAGGASKTVTVTVVPNGSTVGPTTDDDDAIYSKTVLMKSQTVKDFVTAGTLTNPRDLMKSEFNEVHAVKSGQTIADPIADTTDVTQTFTNGDWNDIKAGTVGNYSVTYACGGAAPQKVRVIIVKDNAHVTGLNDAVVADSVTVTSSTAQSLAETDLYGQNYNYVVGYYRDAIGDDIVMVANNDPNLYTLMPQTIDKDDWNAIKVGTTGSYDVMYQIQDLHDQSWTSITPKVTVVPDDSAIVANTGDAVWTHAYITTSAAAKNDFAGKTSDILYGSSTTGTSSEYNRVLIDRSNIILTDDSTPTRKGGSVQTIASDDWSSIRSGTEGQYDVTYAVKTAADATKTDATQGTHVIVMPDGSSIDQDGSAAVHAKTVTITASQAKALGAKSALYGSSYNSVTAAKDGSLISSGALATTLTQTIADVDWTSITTGTTGSYDVTYAVPGSTAATTVKVVVVPDETTVDPATNDSVTAYPAVMTSTTAKGLTAKTDLYGASYNNVSGNIAGVATTADHISQTFAGDDADWSSINTYGKVGTYKVTYETNDNPAAARKVNVVIVPDGSDVEGKDSAYAGTKVYTVTQAKALTDKTELYAAQTDNATGNGTAFTTDQMVAGETVNGRKVAQVIADSSWNSITAGTPGRYASNIQVLDTTDGDAVKATSTTGYVIVVPDKAVVDPATADAVMATSCLVDQSTAKALSSADELYGGGAGLYNQVWGAVGGTPVPAASLTTSISQTFDDQTGAWDAIHAGTVGSYGVTYETNANEKAKESVTVTVVHDGSTVQGLDAAYAGVKTYTVSEAKALTAKTDLYDAQSMSTFYQGAPAGTSSDKVSLGITDEDFAAIQAGKVGEYESNVTCGAATSTGGKVVVVKDGSVIDPSTSTTVYAASVTLTPAQALALSAATDLYAQNEVSANLDGTAVSEADLAGVVSQAFANNGSDWESIHAGTLGDYQVTYGITSATDTTKTIEKTVHVIIAEHGGNGNGVTCAGNDFMMAKSAASAATDDALVSLAGAKAYDSVNDAAVTPTVSDRGGLAGAAGVYQVTFTAKNAAGESASATVAATVKDDVAQGSFIEIGANDYELSVAEAASPATVGSSRASVVCRTIADHVGKEFTADYSNVRAEKGTYDVTFTSVDDPTVSVTVTCTVKDSVATDATSGEVVSANDFTLPVSDVAGLTIDSAIVAGAVTARNVATGVTVAIDNADLSSVKPTPGSYPVTYATAAGTTVSVMATVTGPNTVVDTETGEGIDAAGFTISAGDVSSLSSAAVIARSGAAAWKLADGTSVDIVSVDFSAVRAATGTYVVTLMTAAGTTKTIVVTVTDSVEPVTPAKPVTPASSVSAVTPETGDATPQPWQLSLVAAAALCASALLRGRRRDAEGE